MDNADTQATHHPSVDERWMAEWVDFGFVEIERYLRRQAQFDAYLRGRDVTDEA